MASACRGAPSSSAREASPTSPSHLIRKQRVPPPHFTTSRGRGAPPRPPCRGSSSHSRTRKHLLLRKMVLTQLCRQGEQPTRTTRKANKTEQPTRALQETTLLPRKPWSRPGRRARSDQGSLRLHEPRRLTRGSRRLWGTELCFSKSLQLLTRVFFNSLIEKVRHVETTSF